MGFAAGSAAGVSAAQAMGVVGHTNPAIFLTILSRANGALVVMSEGGVFRTKYQYLTSYKGLTFHTESAKPLELPADVEFLTADSILVAEG
jgi:hypothetical protein